MAVAEQLSNIEAEYQRIPLDKIVPTPDNPRHVRDDDPETVSLAESIRAHGVLQPALARPHPEKPGMYDLRAGARRLCAARMAGLKTLPVMVREMTDNAAFEITMHENWQRQDLTAMEEACAIETMLDRGWTLEQVSAQCDHSTRWVVRRAQLTRLSEAWRTAASDPGHPVSDWSAAHLECIAALPENVQEEAWESMGKWQALAEVTLSRLRQTLARQVRALAHAAWKLDDATLVPAAGACSSCSKRSDCQPELFDDSDWDEGGYVNKPKPGARCLDATCFESKQKALIDRVIEQQRAKHGETLVLVGGYQESREIPGVIQEWDTTHCKKTDAGAVPVVDVRSGQTAWRKLRKGSGSGETGTTKTLKEKRAQLQKKRDKWLCKAVLEKLEDVSAELRGDAVLIPLALATLGSRSNYWSTFDREVKRTSQEVQQALADKVTDALQDHLRNPQDYNMQSAIETAQRVCSLYAGLDLEDLERLAVAKNPEPKAWAEEKKAAKAAPTATERQTDCTSRAGKVEATKTETKKPRKSSKKAAAGAQTKQTKTAPVVAEPDEVDPVVDNDPRAGKYAGVPREAFFAAGPDQTGPDQDDIDV